MDAASRAAQAGKMTPTGNFNMQGSGLKNYTGSYGVGIGVPLNNDGPNQSSLGLGASVSQNFGASNGYRYSTKPDFGVGLSYRKQF